MCLLLVGLLLSLLSCSKYSDWFLMTCLVYVFGALVEFAVINFHDSLEARKHETLKCKLNDVDMESGVSGIMT